VTEHTLHDELTLALGLADAVDGLTLPRFQQADFTLGWKDDRSEVTEVDRDAESLLSQLITAARPDHAFFGEEHGLVGVADSPWRWMVDPIDGTSGFVRGIPVWATLLALTHVELGVMVAVVSAPALGRRWWASRGGGAFADGRSCRVSEITALTDAQVSVTFDRGWEELGLTAELVAIQQEARRARGFGDFWQHCLVAEGAIDVAIDAVGVAPYDIAAVSLLVTEAGGALTDLAGAASHEGPTAISSNGRLHETILSRLRR
jgi:histidinol-phosphatase